MNDGKVIDLAEMSEIPPCINGKTPRLWITTGHTSYLEKRTGSGSGAARWHKPRSMEGENIIRMNARGEAITAKRINSIPYRDTPPKLWRNGKYTDLNDKNLTSKPDNVTITKAIDLASNGIILVQAIEGAVKKTGILLPVEVVNNNKNSISILKVGKMSETGVLSGTEESAILDIEKDSDRFFIRVKGGAALGGISVKVSTTDNPDTTYNDNTTQIDLLADGTDAISKSMLLVSDDVDDDHPVDTIADDATGDRTHKVQLGGNFKIDEIKIGSRAWQTLDSKLTVPAEKTVTVNVVILRNKSLVTGGVAVISELAVNAEFKEVNERYAQAGIRITHNLSTVDPPLGVDLSDGLTEFIAVGSATAEEHSLITGAGTATTDDIHVFYVNHLTSSFGEVFREAVFPAPLGENIIAGAETTPGGGGTSSVHFNVAHELGHLLKNDGSHPYNPYQLMRGGGTSATNTLGASKRFLVDEITTMRGSKHAK
jgi:hypothetical protein